MHCCPLGVEHSLNGVVFISFFLVYMWVAEGNHEVKKKKFKGLHTFARTVTCALAWALDYKAP